MKILITGATGFIGAEVLSQAITNRYITEIVVLTRKPIDASFLASPKVQQVLHDDFSTYPEELMLQLVGPSESTPSQTVRPVEGCIWCLGGPVKSFPSLEQAQRVGIHFTLQAGEAFAKQLATRLDPPPPRPSTTGSARTKSGRQSSHGTGGDVGAAPRAPTNKYPFRFVYISGWGAEQDSFRKLWMFGDSRRIKGAAEKGLFEIADASEVKGGRRCFEAIALRPGGVLRKSSSLATTIVEGVVPSCTVDRLAGRALKVVLNGPVDEGQRILENREILGDEWAAINTVTK